MADVDQIQRRRELRRKRILENSEDRLKKLTSGDRSITQESQVISNGKLHQDEPVSSGVHQSHPSGSLQACSDQLPPATGPFSGSLRDLNKNHRRPAHNRVLGDYDSDSDEGNYSRNERKPSRVQDDSRNVQTLPKILSENKPCFKPKVDGTTRSSLPKSNSMFLHAHLVAWRKWLFVLLAILGQLIVRSFAESTLQQLITLPVIALEVSILGVEFLTRFENQQQPQGLMAAALLLCGIKNAVGLTYLFNTVARVLQDFAVYFFVFFVCHQSLEAIG